MTYFANRTIQSYFDSAKLIVFDMNGLIIGDEGYQFLSYKKILNQYGIDVGNEEWISDHVGHPSAKILRTLFDAHGKDVPDHEIARKVEEKNLYYQSIIEEAAKEAACPGVIDLIESLKRDTESFLAVATSASRREVDAILGKNGLDIEHYFDHILDSSQVRRTKPHPEVYERTIDYFGVETRDTLVLEDTGIGIDAGSGAGAKTIAVPNDYTRHMNFQNADLIISNLTQTADIL